MLASRLFATLAFGAVFVFSPPPLRNGAGSEVQLPRCRDTDGGYI